MSHDSRCRDKMSCRCAEWAARRNRGDNQQEYEVNAPATRQAMRSFVCSHRDVEYYFKGAQKLVTYPWRLDLINAEN